MTSADFQQSSAIWHTQHISDYISAVL